MQEEADGDENRPKGRRGPEMAQDRLEDEESAVVVVAADTVTESQGPLSSLSLTTSRPHSRQIFITFKHYWMAMVSESP